ncbi:MAG: molybdopterin adenylyltransferase [Proteobacteria bacterium]|nr:molybdopterin adenylyltransferase [Pseudomonadota bacterium]
MVEKIFKVGMVTVSDRAFHGEYEDKGGPAIREWLEKALASEWVGIEKIVPDEQDRIEDLLKLLADSEKCSLVLTTGGTGPAKRDVTPEATLAIADKVMDGFGERMRSISLKYVPTAILSRQVGVVRGECLIVNLPGQPKAIKETLDELFEAIPYCIELIDGPYVETHEEVVKAFRPKSAKRPK